MILLLFQYFLFQVKCARSAVECACHVTLQRLETAKRGHLIDALVAFYWFPNFAHAIPVNSANTMAPTAPITHSFSVKFSRL